MSQLSGAEILAFRSVAASAENDAIAARQNTNLLAQAYIDLQVENLRLTEQRDELLAALDLYSLPIDNEVLARAEFGDDAVNREIKRRAAFASVKGQS